MRKFDTLTPQQQNEALLLALAFAATEKPEVKTTRKQSIYKTAAEEYGKLMGLKESDYDLFKMKGIDAIVNPVK